MKNEAAPLIKVSRVRSVGEAETLERLGVDIIGVSLAPEHGAGLFDDDRARSMEAVAAIGHSLTRSRLAVALADPVSENVTGVLELAVRCSAAYVQVPAFALPDPDVVRALAAASIGLIVGRFDVSHDDDPGWILSPLEDLDDAGVTFAELQLLPDQDDAWHFLTTECPRFSEDLQIEDIDALGRTTPLLVSVNATPGNANDILRALPNIHGLSLTLGRLAPGRYDVHAVALDDAVAVIREIRTQPRI